METALNKKVMQLLRGLHPVRVENPACAGTPDINYTGGWIEDKQLPKWPLPGRVVRCEHFTPQQRTWHTMRSLAGGVSYVMLQVGTTYLLFRGWDAAKELGKVDEQTLRDMALGVWERSINQKQFLELLVTE
jgi:hypothetical protein